MLCELETDKVTVEVPATASGVLAEIVAKEGQTVGVDALLATIDEKAEAKAREAGQARAGGAAGRAAAAKTQPGKTAPEEAESAPANARTIDIMVPTLGESVTEATVATWFKKQGDSVVQDETLAELETDKVSVEVPAPASGTLSEILAPVGATVARERRARPDQRRPGRGRPGRRPPAGRRRGAAPPPAARRDVEDAPSAKKLMAERGHRRRPGRRHRPRRPGDEGGRAQGPRHPAPAAPAPQPAPAPIPRAPVPAEDAAREERVKMTRLRQTIARRLKEAQNTAAMLTTYNEVDMSGVMALRNEYKDLFEKKHGVKLGFMSLLHQGLLPRAEGGARGQRRDRRHRGRLQELRAHGHRRRHPLGPGGAGGARRRPAVASPRSRRRSTSSAPAPATASSRWPRCRAAPSPSPTAASTAR